jgi:hypothetical protein
MPIISEIGRAVLVDVKVSDFIECAKKIKIND